MKSLFDYTDYRRYLQDYYLWAKENKRGFSHRAFLAKAGMSGPNYLKRVMEGVHNLTDKSIPKFAQALELDAASAEYFSHLVHFNQAETLEEKDRQFERLMGLKSQGASLLLEKAQYDYYTEWFNVALREMMHMRPYHSTAPGEAAEFGKALVPPVPPKKVKKAVELMANLGLLKLSEDGHYRPASSFILTSPEIQSFLVPKFHLAMARLAAEAVTRFSRDERYFSGTTMTLSKESYEDIIAVIRKARKDMLERVAKDEAPDRVYHLNMQLFPLTAGKAVGRRGKKAP